MTSGTQRSELFESVIMSATHCWYSHLEVRDLNSLNVPLEEPCSGMEKTSSYGSKLFTGPEKVEEYQLQLMQHLMSEPLQCSHFFLIYS